jgi:hypothetical protein
MEPDQNALELLDFLREHNIPPSDALDLIRRCLIMATRSLDKGEVFITDEQGYLTIIVDAELTFANLLRMGKYDVIDTKVNSQNFPITLEGSMCKYEVKMFTFDGRQKMAAIEKMIAAHDTQHAWRVATATQILAFGAQHPERQAKHTIVGLGSSYMYRGGLRCPALSKLGKERKIATVTCGGNLPKTHRFMAVRKEVKVI